MIKSYKNLLHERGDPDSAHYSCLNYSFFKQAGGAVAGAMDMSKAAVLI